MSESEQATILVVDDSEDNRYAVIRHLQQAGFQVLEAESGEETLELINKRPDLVILDVDLPDMSGFEVCQRIKTATDSALIPVLHLSATFTKTRHRVQGLEGGADAYLCHPVEPLELVATVHALLRLKRSEQALLEANRRKDEFLAMLAHELRNPLGPIRSAVEVLRMRESPDPVARSAREIVDRQVSHMSRLVDDLLDVTRIVRGNVPIHRERCDLGRIVRETAEDYRGAAKHNGLTLQVRVPAEPLPVTGDKTRLAQVIGNLLHNAIKFTDRGGEIRIDVQPGGGSDVLIRVRDNGIGMEADTLKDIFEPFAQADRSLARSRGGLGLGLALVKGLVELHGGEVLAESDGLGKGSSFTLRLPVGVGEHADGDGAPAAAADGRPQSILLIEDNTDAVESMRMLLVLLGHAVEVAYSGPAGVEAARQHRPNVVLCDIGLPEMDGYAVARAIRAAPELNDTYLVAVTGYGQQEDRALARSAGFDAHLTKPVALPTLQEVLAESAGRTGAAPRR